MDYSAARGCRDRATAAACLRALPVAKLLNAPGYTAISGVEFPGPVTGGTTLPVDPVTGVRAAAPVPVLIGTTHDEFTYFLAQQLAAGAPPLTPSGYAAALGRAFGDGPAVAAEYPLAAYVGDASRAYAAAVTDSAFACVADHLAATLPSTWHYEFADATSPAAGGLPTPLPLGAAHTFELPYLFDLDGKPAPFTPAQQSLADHLVDTWSAVTAGRPLPGWPVRTVLSFAATGPRPDPGFSAEHHCRFWN